MEKIFHVYLTAGKSGVLYVGVTSNLLRRVYEHKEKKRDGFTERFDQPEFLYQ